MQVYEQIWALDADGKLEPVRREPVKPAFVVWQGGRPSGLRTPHGVCETPPGKLVLGKKSTRRLEREAQAKLRDEQSDGLAAAITQLKDLTGTQHVVVLIGAGCLMDNATIERRHPAVAAIVRGAVGRETEIHPVPRDQDPKAFAEWLITSRQSLPTADNPAPIGLES